MLWILFGGKCKFSTILAFFTFILPGWVPLDTEKLSNFAFIFVVDEAVFEKRISLFCPLKFKQSAKDLKILMWDWDQILNLVVYLLKVLYLLRKQEGVKLVNTLFCYFAESFYWFCYNLIQFLTNFQYFLNATLLFLSTHSLCTGHWSHCYLHRH